MITYVPYKQGDAESHERTSKKSFTVTFELKKYIFIDFNPSVFPELFNLL